MNEEKQVGHGIKNNFAIVGESQVVNGEEHGRPKDDFRFGRMFPNLKAFQPTDESLTKLGDAMTSQGRPEPGAKPDGLHAAGYTYFGQFIDHDITFDRTPELKPGEKPIKDDDLKQARSPSLDLDSLYGDPSAEVKPKMEIDGLHFSIGMTKELPNNPPGDDEVEKSHPNDLFRILGKAQIGDPRNDENLIVAQLHVAFLKFHNKVVDVLIAEGVVASEDMMTVARELVVRHYQWIVLNDFVRRFSDPDVFEAVLTVPDLTDVRTVLPHLLAFDVTGYETPPMPLEFSVAAYRFGHSMVRDGYSWNRVFFNADPAVPPNGSLKLLFEFTELSGGLGHPEVPTTSPANRFNELPSNWIADWRRMFDVEIALGAGSVDRTSVPLNLVRPIDPRLAGGLFTVPGTNNLAARNLVRGAERRLPCAQDIVKALGDPLVSKVLVLTPRQICANLEPDVKVEVREAEFDLKTPLWFYILREAEFYGGNHLGPLGSRLILETFVGLIRTSKTSIFNADHEKPGVLNVWSPANDSTLRVDGQPITTMSHLLAFVGDINPLGD